MKNISIPFLVMSLLFLSCQKNNSLSQKTNLSPATVSTQASQTPSYFMSCQVDGITKNFNIKPVAIKTTTSWNFTILEIRGSSSSPAGETFSIAIDNTKSAKSIGSGFYGDNSTAYSLEAAYLSESAGNFHAGPSGTAQTQNSSILENGVGFHTIITSFSSGEIRGAFSGDIYKDNDPNNAKISITNGAFYVRLN
jgi:hypothetical protein